MAYKDIMEMERLTLEWSHNLGILTNGKLTTQGLKLVSEVGELSDNIAKSKDIRDDIGDCLVVLTNLANLAGTNLLECWSVAYEDIKDRKGFLNEHGNFIKSEDPAYEQLKMEFDAKQEQESTISNLGYSLDPASFGHEFRIWVQTEDGKEERFNFVPNQQKAGLALNQLKGETLAGFKAYLNTFGEIIE